MKRMTGILALLLGLFLLAGCTNQGQSYCPPAEGTAAPALPDAPGETSAPTGGTEDEVTCVGTPENALFRIVDGAEQGTLLLAKLEDGANDVFRLGTAGLEIYQDHRKLEPTALKDGITVEISWRGGILETYPAQWSTVTLLEIKGGADDRCGLYLQVLEDLWEKDSGLNGGIQTIGVDLSGLTHLTESEKSAVAWRFGELHGVPVVEGTFEELVEAGYIDVAGGKAPAGVEHPIYEWTDGILFSITTDAEAGVALPDPGHATVFDAQKWRSGTGAYYFCDCPAVMMPDGTWTYTVSSEVIS